MKHGPINIRYFLVNFKEGITKCSNEVYNKIDNIRQHNKYLLEYIGYMHLGKL